MLMDNLRLDVSRRAKTDFPAGQAVLAPASGERCLSRSRRKLQRLLDANHGEIKIYLGQAGLRRRPGPRAHVREEETMTLTDTSASQPVTIDEIITTVVMARVTDFFGFFVYAIASAIVFPHLFFPTFDPVTGTMLSFLLFSLAFIARPIAGLVGRRVQARIGRRAKVIVALMILGTATVAIGLLPGYAQIGWLAPVLLALLRFTQGIGLGGAWDGLTLQLQNAAPPGRNGFYAMIPQLGGPLGFIVAAALFYVLTGFLTSEEFYEFGWRFTFFAVFGVNVVALFARIRLLESDLGGDARVMQSAPLPELLRDHWRMILVSTFLPLASYALFHMVTVFPLAYEHLYTQQRISHILLLQVFGGVLAVAGVVASGLLADRIPRQRVLWISTSLIVILCLLLGALNFAPALFILPGFLLLGFAYGQASAIVPNRYPPEFRYTGTAISTNLSWLFGAAFAPLAGLTLTATLGLWAAALYLLSAVVVTVVTLYLFQKWSRR
ncbi:MAG: MFS transporter [Rhodobacteraceae bacterium]|nr:MFS transporter [Paracoccaceae bacterium]